MKVILLADVKKPGKKDQTVEVSDGYANNFLFPRHLAVQVTKKSVEVLENQQEERKELAAKMKAEAEELAKKLDKISLVFSNDSTNPWTLESVESSPLKSKKSSLNECFISSFVVSIKASVMILFILIATFISSVVKRILVAEKPSWTLASVRNFWNNDVVKVKVLVSSE